MSGITTAVVGSYPQPAWLVDTRRFRANVVPRVRMPDLWRVPADALAEAQDDAVRLAVSDMERAGVELITDGEQRRESYFNQFATGLGGVDLDRPGTALSRLGKPTPVPRIVGPIVRERAVFAQDAAFLRRLTDRRIKVAVPGPFTLAQLAQDEYYKDDATLAMAYAEAVNAELRELEPLVDVLQLDEPYVEPCADRARDYALPVINRALAGLTKPTCIHVCMGYAYSHALAGTTKTGGYVFATELARSAATHVSLEAAQPRLDVATLASLAAAKTIVLGVLDLGDPTPESADVVAARLREALRHVPRERLVAAPDCGMKYLDRATAHAKLRALVEGAQRV